jgi:hypothetical protein
MHRAVEPLTSGECVCERFSRRSGRSGIAQLLITLLTFWLIVPILIVGIWVLIEVITVKSDAQGLPFN